MTAPMVPLPQGVSWKDALDRIQEPCDNHISVGPEDCAQMVCACEQACADLFGPRPRTFTEDERLISRLREALIGTASGNSHDVLIEEARVRLGGQA